MSKLTDKFLNLMKLNDEEPDEEFDEDYDDMVDSDEEFFDDDDEQEVEPEEIYEEEAPKKSRFGFMRREKEPVIEEPEYEDNRVATFNPMEGETVKVIKPQEFNEAQIVAELLKEGKTIVVNLEGIEISQAQRIIDFVGGASFAVDGTLKAISNNIFIVAPGNIEVSGDLREEIISENMLSPELSKF